MHEANADDDSNDDDDDNDNGPRPRLLVIHANLMNDQLIVRTTNRRPTDPWVDVIVEIQFSI